MKKLLASLSAVAMLSVAAAAWSATPNLVPYQGRLTDGAGSPINGSRDILFSIYTVATGGSAVFSETQTVTVANGLFSVNIGSATAGGVPRGVMTGGDLYLGIKVGTDPEMVPRQQIGSVPYAYRSGISPGASYAVANLNLDAAGDQNLVAASITAPAPGYVIAFGQAYVAANHAVGTIDQVSISVNTTSATMAVYPHLTRWAIDSNAPSVGFAYQTGLPIMRVMPVAAGTTTFYLVGEENSGNIHYWAAQLTLQYVPDAIGSVAPPPPLATTGADGLAPSTSK